MDAATMNSSSINDNLRTNATLADIYRNYLSNHTREDLENILKALKSSSSCDGWMKDVATEYERHHWYISLAVCIFGTIANAIIIVVLTRKDMASVPIYKILTGLAVADMLVMVEYIPYSIYWKLESHQKNFSFNGAVFLLSHTNFCQVMHTISIFLTLTLAVWRYIAINHPQRSVVLCTEARCRIAITCSYILPIFVCIPSYFITKIDSTRVSEPPGLAYILQPGDNTFFTQSFNFWTYAVVIKLLPCLILSVISFCLIKALYQVNKRKEALKGYNVCKNGTEPLERKPSKRDCRAERTTAMLVAVLLLFLTTEFPQGVLGLLNGIYGEKFYVKCYQQMGPLLDILALVNSAINFILYCAMSRQFRLQFAKLVRPKVLVHWGPKPSQSEVQSTYV